MKLMKKGEKEKLSNKRCSSAGLSKFHVPALPWRLFCLCALVASGTVMLGSDNTFAAASSISLNVSSDTVSVDVASLNAAGTFAKSGNTTITASTTNASGYELKIAAANSSDPSHLIHTSDSNAKLNSISSATTEAQFSALTGTAYNNMWGYLPSKYNSAANSDFLPAPDTTGDVINKTECANGTSPCPAQDTYTMAIGARVDSTTRIGAYENTYVILATANAIPYTIIYDDNVIGNMPVDVNSTSVSTSIPISSNTPTRDGYKFLRWCSVVPTNNNGTDTCSGTTYAPGSSWTISQTGTNNLHLYAMWSSEIDYCDDSSYDCMQEITSCTTSANDVIDDRDGEVYKIQMLADGNCWMLDNLRLDPTAISLNILYFNTNASNNTLNYLKNGGGTTSNKYATAGVAHWASSVSYSAPIVNTLHKDTTTTSYGTGSGKVGVYYNYCAASAGSYCYGNGASAGTSSADATEDLCPYGWRMPTMDEYEDLYTAYSRNATNFRNALSTPLSGDSSYSGQDSSQIGTMGLFWSRTRSANNIMGIMDVTASSVTTYADGARNEGLSMRCLLDS